MTLTSAKRLQQTFMNQKFSMHVTKIYEPQLKY